jgi:hypothetical protein
MTYVLWAAGALAVLVAAPIAFAKLFRCAIVHDTGRTVITHLPQTRCALCDGYCESEVGEA